MSITVTGQPATIGSDPGTEWLTERVDRWLTDMAGDGHRHHPGWFHASQLGKDDAELIAQYRGEVAVEEPDPRRQRIFDLGHERDRAWKRYLAGAGLSVVGEDEDRDVRLPHLRLCGSFDDMARHPDTGEFFIVEFKTINPYGYSQLAEPLPEHRQQVTAYMAATRVEQAIVLYECKGDQMVRTFLVQFDPVLWQGIVERLLRLRREAEA